MDYEAPTVPLPRRWATLAAQLPDDPGWYLINTRGLNYAYRDAVFPPPGPEFAYDYKVVIPPDPDANFPYGFDVPPD